MGKKKILAVIDEAPYDPQTWSGSSKFFFEALRETGDLYQVVSAQPATVVKKIYQILSFHPFFKTWKFKYHLNTNYYHKMTNSAKRLVNRFDSNLYQLILQIGAWYDMTGTNGKPVVSYHDGNLATLLASPYKHPRIDKTYINRALSYEKCLYNRINLIFPMSRWLADSFTRDFGINHRKIFPVGAGINLSKVLNVDNKSYEQHRILFVGKDFKRKGGADLLNAFERVKREIKDAELTIIGPKFESIPEGVRYLGEISKSSIDGEERLLNEYARATIFVMPSLYEPFGIAFAEAMAHHLPCIGANICAMPEIIQHGTTGFIVPPNNPEALAKSILNLLNEPERCRSFGERGYQHYEQSYTWHAVTSRICEVIDNEL